MSELEELKNAHRQLMEQMERVKLENETLKTEVTTLTHTASTSAIATSHTAPTIPTVVNTTPITTTYRPKRLAMNNTQNTFSGNKSENINDWLTIVDTNMRIANVDISEYVLVASSYLRANALQFFQSIIGSNPTWEQFKDALKKYFLPANYEVLLYDKVNTLKVKENLQEYIKDFNYMINQINHLSEIQKILMFRQNLSADTKGYLGLINPTTLIEAQEKAISYEAHVKNKIFISDPTINQMQANRNKYCSKCNRNNHWTKDCFKNNANNNQNKPNNKQSYNNNNYYATYQRQNHSDFKNTKQKSDQQDTQTKYNKQTCTYCNKSGHAIDKCFKRQNSNKDSTTNSNKEIDTIEKLEINPQIKSIEINNKLISTTVLINKIELEAIFDTGATQSVIPLEIVQKYKIPFNKSDITCHFGDGETRSIIGITEKLEVIVHGSYTTLEFLILPRKTTLLGYDWFCSTQSTVFPHNKSLLFEKRHIYLDNREDDDNLELNITEINTIEDNEELIEDQLEEEWNFTNIPFTMHSNTNLTKEENIELKQLIDKFQDTFAKSLNDLRSPCNIGKFEIKLSDQTPIFQYPYRKSIKEREEIQIEIQKMLDAKIIRPSQSPWSAPILLLKKPDGSKRFCIDYRKINKVTIQDKFPMQRIDDIFDNFNGSEYFSEFDFNRAYWQLEIDKNDIEKTAFATPDAHYEFMRLPFGLTNGTRAFSRLMHTIFGDMKCLQVYLDNVVVHSKTKQKHFLDVKDFLIRTRSTMLKLNFQKCKWFQKTIKLLGHIISKNKLMMDPEKIEKVKNWPTPKNSKQVSQFLGFTNYYNHYINHYADITAPLSRLLSKDVEFKWCVECIEAFQNLKDIMCSEPILRQPNFQLPFVIFTDASALAAGAILSQTDNDGEYVVSYGSKKFKNSELHYSVTEKECLAVLWAIKLYRIYLYGIKFTIVTDHKALKWLMDIVEPTGRLARWSIYLQAYDFEIIHRPGLKHANADAMSRIYSIEFIENNVEENRDYSEKSLDVWEDANFLTYLKTGKQQSGSSKKQIKRIKDKSENYKLDNDKIWYTTSINDKIKLLQVPRPEERQELIKKAHLLGHTNSRRTFERLKENFYWKNMMTECDRIIRNCIPCLQHKRTIQKEHPAVCLPINKIFDRIAIDLVLGLPETEEGFNGIMVITEYLTKYPYAIPIKSKTADEISSHLMQYISLFGPPHELLSDQGKEFVNNLVNKLLAEVGTEHIITSSYHPRTDGLCERYNQTLIRAIRKHADDNNKLWHKWLPYCLMAYRDTIHSSTGYTPYELLFGRSMNKFIEYNKNENEIEQAEITQRLAEIKKMFETTIPIALDNIKKAQKQQIVTQNSAHTIQDQLLKIDDEVYIEVKKLHSKLEPDYIGPYFIDGITKRHNYWLRNAENIRMKKRQH